MLQLQHLDFYVKTTLTYRKNTVGSEPETGSTKSWSPTQESRLNRIFTALATFIPPSLQQPGDWWWSARAFPKVASICGTHPPWPKHKRIALDKPRWSISVGTMGDLCEIWVTLCFFLADPQIYPKMRKKNKLVWKTKTFHKFQKP